MIYTRNAQDSINNLMHNIKLIEDHAQLEKLTEGMTERWCSLIRLKEECFRELGAWYYAANKNR